MNANFLVGIGAGLASALLYLSVTTGNPASVVLFYAAPLPLFIAGFGWGLYPAAIAAIAGLVAAGLAAHPVFAIIYAVSCAAPCVWLVRLALLSRPLDEGDPRSAREWYPAGRLVLWTAAFGAVVAITAIIALGGTADSYGQAILQMLRGGLPGAGAALPDNAPASLLAEILTRFLAPMSAALWTLFTLLNMWLAVRIAAASGRAIRPAIGLRAMRFPPQASGALAAALAGAYIGGTLGLYAKAFVGALIAAFLVLGLAVIYGLTRGMAAQPAILAGVFVFALFIPLVAVAVALVGIGDTLFDFRSRKGPPAPPGST